MNAYANIVIFDLPLDESQQTEVMQWRSTSTIQAFKELGSDKTTFLIVSDDNSFVIKSRLDLAIIRLPGFIIIELGKAERGKKSIPAL